MDQSVGTYNKTKLCRACATEEGTLHLLFNNILCENKFVNISHMFENITSMPCSEEDVYPTRICARCKDTLIVAYNFKQKCLASIPILQQKIFALKKNNDPIYISQANKNNINSPVTQIKGNQCVIITPISSDIIEVKKCGDHGKSINLEDANENPVSLSLVSNSAMTVTNQTSATDSVTLNTQVRLSQNQKKFTEFSNNNKVENISKKSGTQSDVVKENESGPQCEYYEYKSTTNTNVNLNDESEKNCTPNLAFESKNIVSKHPDVYDTIEIDTDDDDDDVVLVVERDILADIEPKCDETVEVEQKIKPRSNNRTPPVAKKYKNPYKCTACSVSYEVPDDLMIHTINIHADSGPFLCPYLDCPMTCSTLLEYKLHREKHTGNKLVDMKCEICDSVFHNLYEFNRHKRKHEKDKRFKCDVCKQQFIFRKEIRNHILEHSKSMFEGNQMNTESSVKFCNLCPHLGPFGSPDKIFQHLYYEHISIIYYTCSVCSETFAIQSSLSKHVCKPDKTNSPKLSVVNISAANQNIHNRNIIMESLTATVIKNTTSTENEFILPDVDSSDVPIVINNDMQENTMTDQDKYVMGMKNKSEETRYEEPPKKKICSKPYTCTICLSTFVVPDGLMLHMLTNHADCGTFLCPYSNCLTAFSSLEEYKSHRETHDEDKNVHELKLTAKFKCEVCDILFYQSSDLYKHRSKHNTVKKINCNICLKDIIHESVNVHIRNHSKAMYENVSNMCRLCLHLGPFETSETLYLHLLCNHISELHYHCVICPMSFSEKNQFSKHMRNHEDPNSFQICLENSVEYLPSKTQL